MKVITSKIASLCESEIKKIIIRHFASLGNEAVEVLDVSFTHKCEDNGAHTLSASLVFEKTETEFPLEPAGKKANAAASGKDGKQ